MSETELAEQGEVVRGFLVDLLDAFGLDGEVTATPAEEGAVELAVTGDDLGPADRPQGRHPAGVQELSRSVLQRQLPGESHARIRVDVGGYRARRREALERFVRTGRRGRADLRHPEGPRADGAAGPQGRPRHRQRDRRRAHGLGGRGRSPPGRDHPRRLAARPDVDDPPALLEHEPLLAQLERARTLGFLGPGPGRATTSTTPAAFLDRPGRGAGHGRRPGQRRRGARPRPRPSPGRTSRLVLVEATAKRCRFLEEAVRRARARRARVVEGRAEASGTATLRGDGRCASWPGASAPRPPPPSAPRPLLRLGGRPGRERAAGRRRRTAGRRPALAQLGLAVGPRSAGSPVVQILQQSAPCPAEYPRRDGLPPSGRCSEPVPRGTRRASSG